MDVDEEASEKPIIKNGNMIIDLDDVSVLDDDDDNYYLIIIVITIITIVIT